jgi:hypothetical protein
MPVTNLKSYEEYKNFYMQYRSFPDGQYTNPEKFPLNEKQIKAKYDKYARATEKKESKGNTPYMEAIFIAEKEARDNDPLAETFWGALNENQLQIIRQAMKLIPDFSILDPCHILPRGTTPQLSACVENILIAPRVFQHYLDGYMNPFSSNHETITKEKQNEIWISIIGIDRWNHLQDLKKGGIHD